MWVKSGKTRLEYLLSALAPIADLIAEVSPSPLCARIGLIPCSKFRARVHVYSITLSARPRGEHVEAERLGGLKADHCLEFCGLLHRQVGRLLAFEDAINVAGCQSVLVGHTSRIDIRPPAATRMPLL